VGPQTVSRLEARIVPCFPSWNPGVSSNWKGLSGMINELLALAEGKLDIQGQAGWLAWIGQFIQ
jgi:hypothetical protein